MVEENTHMACSDPDEIVLLKYIRDEVSDEEREWIECWLKEDETRNEIVLQLASIDYALYTKNVLNRAIHWRLTLKLRDTSDYNKPENGSTVHAL